MVNIIEGTPGDDVLNGTDTDDQIFGLGGDDQISGERGDDILEGGEGDDILDAGPGDDESYGGPGDDTLFDGEGDDLIDGGDGADEIWLGPGEDEIRGGADSDRFVVSGIQESIDENLISDFERGSDKLDFRQFETLNWFDLDTNRNGVLDKGDDRVTVHKKKGTTIDISDEYGHEDGTDTIRIAGVTGLIHEDIPLPIPLDLDIVVGNFLDPNQLMINEGGAQGGIEGRFESAFNLPGGDTRVTDLKMGDVDGDGDLDILVANDLQPNQLLVNQGGDQAGKEGTFAVGPDLPGVFLGSREIALADIDGDGDLDALIANYRQPNELLINQGGSQGGIEGGYALGPNLPGFGDDDTWDIAAGDVDGDGDLDAVVSNLFEPNRLLINDGGQQGGTEGQFSLGPNLPGGVKQSREIALGDIDSDGDLDALVANSDSVGTNVNQVLINQGGQQGGTEGQFSLGPNLPGTGLRSAGVALGDVDSDGDLDAIVINSFSTVRGAPNLLLMNQGGNQGGVEGLFELGPDLPGGNLVSADIHFGDVDADTDLDVLIVNRGLPGQGEVDQLLINQGGSQNGQEGTFALGEELPGEIRSGFAGAFGDIDGDGIGPTLTSSGLPYVGDDELLPYAADLDYLVG